MVRRMIRRTISDDRYKSVYYISYREIFFFSRPESIPLSIAFMHGKRDRGTNTDPIVAEIRIKDSPNLTKKRYRNTGTINRKR